MKSTGVKMAPCRGSAGEHEEVHRPGTFCTEQILMSLHGVDAGQTRMKRPVQMLMTPKILYHCRSSWGNVTAMSNYFRFLRAFEDLPLSLSGL